MAVSIFEFPYCIIIYFSNYSYGGYGYGGFGYGGLGFGGLGYGGLGFGFGRGFLGR
jgi:hypothetical protein